MKTKLTALAGACIIVLAFIVNLLMVRLDKARQKAREAQARANHATDVLEKDIAINEQEDIRLKEAADEIDTSHSSSELSDPNHWEWVSDDSD